MRFKRRLSSETCLTPIDVMPLLNFVLLLLIFFMLISTFFAVPGMHVVLPSLITGADLNQKTIALIVSEDGVIYINDKPYDVSGLDTFIKRGKFEYVLIKANRNVGMGVVTKIWELCKRLGIEKINIVTTTDE